jgi:hypothetical protein
MPMEERAVAANLGALDSKTRGVLVRLCNKLGALTTTQAVKLPYLADVVAVYALGSRITPSEYQTWDLGVVAPDVWRAITKHRLDDAFEISKHEYTETGYAISLVHETPDGLSDEEREIVDFVADEYGARFAPDLGQLTKGLNPSVRNWGSNSPASLDDETFHRLSDCWQMNWSRLPRLGLANRERWGEPITDAREYVKTLLR